MGKEGWARARHKHKEASYLVTLVSLASMDFLIISPGGKYVTSYTTGVVLSRSK